ncbi:MAG: hypothetical protein ACOYK8_07195 [Alphaproteobacteria bacterium]
MYKTHGKPETLLQYMFGSDVMQILGLEDTKTLRNIVVTTAIQQNLAASTDPFYVNDFGRFLEVMADYWHFDRKEMASKLEAMETKNACELIFVEVGFQGNYEGARALFELPALRARSDWQDLVNYGLNLLVGNRKAEQFLPLLAGELGADFNKTDGYYNHCCRIFGYSCLQNALHYEHTALVEQAINHYGGDVNQLTSPNRWGEPMTCLDIINQRPELEKFRDLIVQAGGVSAQELSQQSNQPANQAAKPPRSKGKGFNRMSY